MLEFLIEIMNDMEGFVDKDVPLAQRSQSNAHNVSIKPELAMDIVDLNETAALAFSTLLGVASNHDVVSVTLIVVIGAALSLLTTLGNMLVIVSFKMDRHLQTINNYFLLSLAVADLVVGCVSIPLMTLYTASGSWPLGYEVCQLWLNIDYMMSNASVLNLLLISTDRFLSVTMPLTYRPRRTKKRAMCMIVLTFLISSILWPPWIISWPYIEGKFISNKVCIIQFLVTNPYVTLGTACAAFYVPVTIMVILYTKVYRVTKQRSEAIKRLQGFHKRSMCLARATNTHLRRSKAINALPEAVEVNSSTSDVVDLPDDDEEEDEEEEESEEEEAEEEEEEEEKMQGIPNSPCNFNVPQVKVEPSSPVKKRLKLNLLPSWRLKSNPKADQCGPHCLRRYSHPNDHKPCYKRALRFSQVLDLENFTQYQKSPVGNMQSNLIIPSEHHNSTSTIDGSVYVKEDIYSMIAAMDGGDKCDIENRLAVLSDSQKDISLQLMMESTGDVQDPSQSTDSKRSGSLITPSRPLLCHLLPSFLAMTVTNRPVSGSRIKQKLMKMNRSINLAAKLRKSESKAAKMLSAILLAFIFTWLPYNVIVLVEAFVPLTVPPLLFTLSYYLCYLNSTVNPFCYALCNRAFRRTYVRILSCKWKERRRTPLYVQTRMDIVNND